MSFQWSWIRSRIRLTLVKHLIALISLSVVLTGCSGGGGGGGGGVPANTAPVITASCSTTNEADMLMGMLMATDADPISFSLDIANPMVMGPVPTANGGSVMLTDVTTGAYTYTPPTGGPRGVDTFEFRVDDPASFSTSTETVIVNPKIMPLGDSITEGSGGATPPALEDRVAYRLELLNQLNAAGFEIEYVGFLENGQNLLPTGQAMHSGYPAFRDNEIAFGAGDGAAPSRSPPLDQYTGIFDELEKIPADIVLLHIGTNSTNFPTVTDPSAVRSILTEIGRWEDSPNGNPVSVFVAGIIDRLPSDPNVAIRNQNIINMIMAGAGADPWPEQIVFGAEVDMLTALYNGGVGPDPSLYADPTVAVHPNQAGYQVMGGVWFNAITGANQPTILQTCP
jgi:hypothetical protein